MDKYEKVIFYQIYNLPTKHAKKKKNGTGNMMKTKTAEDITISVLSCMRWCFFPLFPLFSHCSYWSPQNCLTLSGKPNNTDATSSVVLPPLDKRLIFALRCVTDDMRTGKQTHHHAPWEAQTHFGDLHQERHGESFHAEAAPVEDSTLVGKHLQLLVRPANLFESASEIKTALRVTRRDRKASGKWRERRVLQTSCAAGNPFTVVSTIVPEVAGCYSDTGSTNENEVYYSETGTTDTPQNIVGAFDLGEAGTPDVSASLPSVCCPTVRRHEYLTTSMLSIRTRASRVMTCQHAFLVVLTLKVA